MSKRFILWSAVSSLPQVEKVSLENQLELARRVVDKHDGRIIAELVVPGESRDIVLFEDACREIAAYDQLRDLIQRKVFDVLVFLNPSRLGRTAALVMAVEELCRRAGVVLYDLEAPPHSLDVAPASHADLLIAAIKSVGAQNEIIELRRRHAMGMADRTRKGLFPRGAPWGWIQAADGRIEINPIAQRALNLLIDFYLHHGAGQIEIATRLNETGIPSPDNREWTKNSVAVILDRIWTYAGYAELNRRSKSGRPYIRAPGQFPALIDDATATAIETERRRRVSARRSINTVYRFSQCILCAECGRRMNAQAAPSDYGHYINEYYCRNKHPGGYVTERHVELTMLAQIEELKRIEDLTTLLPPADTHAEDTHAAIAALEDEIHRYRARLEKADDDYIDGVLPADRYQRQVARINGQIADARRQIETQRQSLELDQHRAGQLDRLTEASAVGLHMLTLPDAKIANAWFRTHCQIYVQNNRVIAVRWL